ncbi:hypothetical protein D9M72_604340 [compost metagenome]
MRQFRLECRIVLCLVPLGLQVEDQGHQCLGHEAAAKNAETAVLVGTAPERIQLWRLVHVLLPDRGMPASAWRTASKNDSMSCRSLTPGALSTPEDVSMAQVRVCARASPMLFTFKPPESM